jgi:hypothetical protein
MTAAALLNMAAAKGLKVSINPDGKRLDVEGPTAAIGELAPSLKEHKADVIAHIHGQVTGKILPFILPAPDARALLGHCTRVRPDTSTTDADVEALGAYFASLTREKAIAAERRCWAYWKAAAAPTVGGFLAAEPKAKGGAA